MDKIYDKIIAKANNFAYIKGIEINILKSELDVILSQEDNNARDLLFVYLVYYKWASQINYLSFYSKKNEVNMVVEKDNDLWKLANLYKLKVRDRYMICNKFVNDGLYKQDNFKISNYFYLPFANSNSEPVFTINNFENILGELEIYLFPNEYIRCKECNIVIKRTTNNKKYCVDCAKEISNQQKNNYRAK